MLAKSGVKQGRPRKTILIGGTYGQFVVISHEQDEMFIVKCPAGHEQLRSEKSLRETRSRCHQCYLAPKSLINRTFNNKTVIADTGERTPSGKIVYLLKCNACETETKAVPGTFKKATYTKCVGCEAKRFALVTQFPLVLTDAQAKTAMEKARVGVYSVLPMKKAIEEADEIVSEVMLDILSRGASVISQDIGALACTLAKFAAKHRLNPHPLGKQLREAETTQDGKEGGDIWETINTEKRDTGDSVIDELERAALSTLSEPETSWMYEYQSRRGAKSKADRARFAELTQKVRDAHTAIVAVVTDEGKEDNAIAA